MTIADIVIAAVLVLSAWIGARKGLVKSLAGVVIVVAAFVGASFVADALAQPVADWLEPMVQQQIQDKLALQDAADASDMLSAFHFTGESLQQLADEVMEKVQETGMSLLTAVADSVTRSIAYAVVYVLAFLALLIVLWLLMKPVYLALKLPGLRTINALGGGVLGLVWGALLVFLAVWAMLRFDWVLTREMVESSGLLGFFANNSPISLITSL